MSKTYWISFRLHDDNTYDKRYSDLVETIRKVSSTWWVEPSSFIVFGSEYDISTIAGSVKTAINPDTDMTLIGMPDYKSARLIGVNEDEDIVKLIPFVKKL